MTDLDAALAPELARLEALRLRRRLQPMDAVDGASLRAAEAALLSFSSNDYLGLARDDRLQAALCAGAARDGVGSGAAHLLGGHRGVHQALEEALAAFAGREAALLFGNGYLANLGMIGALAGRGDTIFADRLNHASLVDAALLSRARLLRYRHADLQHLEDLLKTAPARGRRLIVTDGVFSMDGDVAPLVALTELARRHRAWLVVDDAHGLGVLGPDGRGSVAAAGLDEAAVPVLMGTLGKAFGVYGAFVAGSRILVDTLLQRARTYIYTTALPPALAHATLTALDCVRGEPWRRERLREHVHALRAGLAGLPWTLLPSDTPIQPLLVGGADAAVALSEVLRARGIYVPAVRPPTVPQGTARLRITLSAAHTATDVERLVRALRELAGG
ncbi:MAG: 8-amino-7-oxononanoate synthase [Pseudomonadota bacterium]